MTVVPFVPLKGRALWRADELPTLMRLVRLLAGRLGAQSWDTAATERGDPQLYVLGPAPEQRCIACISKINGTYVLEDGAGALLSESRCLDELMASARRSMPRAKLGSVAARAFVALCAGRAFVEERMFLVEESAEILSRAAPHLAVFA